MSRASSLVKRIFAVFLAVICVLCISACGEQSSHHPKDAMFTFKDALNRTVTIQKKPQRVATLLGSFADVWMLAGGTIKATAEDAWSDFNLDIKDAVNIGGAHSPNLEMLMSANPDFVIASASTASNVEFKESLEGAGITVAYFDVDNFYDYLDMLEICAKITDRPDLYQKNGIEIKKSIDKIKADFKESELPLSERTVLVLRASSKSIKAKGSTGTILGEMLGDLGCVNVADSDTSLLENLSIESIIKYQPKHIFVVTMGDGEKALENIEKTIKENPAWATLEAVEQNKMHFMDPKMFNLKPNARWAKSYEKLYELLCEKN